MGLEEVMDRCPWVKKNYLPVALTTALILGLLVPAGSRALDKPVVGGFRVVQTLCVAYIFLAQGMSLQFNELRQAFEAKVPFLFALASILFITPLFGLLAWYLEFLAMDLRVGLVLFYSMPTTINSGVALVAQAKGNSVLALLITLATNSLAVLTLPLLLPVFLATELPIELDAAKMLLKLVVTIVLPALVGIALRAKVAAVGPFCKRYKLHMTMSSATALAVIPYMKVGVSQAAIVALDAQSLIGVVLTALLFHGLLLAWNYGATGLFPGVFPTPIRKAVVLMASEKTLPVAMAVLSTLPADLGEPGLIAIPCILNHFCQIIVDASVAARWALVLEERLQEDRDSGSAKDPAAPLPLGAPADDKAVSPDDIEAPTASTEANSPPSDGAVQC